MNKLLLLIAFFTASFAAYAQDDPYDGLATFSMNFELQGMQAPGQPAGVMDRNLTFLIYIDPTDLEAATKAWYAHLDMCIGDKGIGGIRAKALEWADERGRR